MNNQCNNCAKFLACNRKNCNKITFVEAGILDKPKMIKNDNEIVSEALMNIGKTMEETYYCIQIMCKEWLKGLQEIQNETKQEAEMKNK